MRRPLLACVLFGVVLGCGGPPDPVPPPPPPPAPSAPSSATAPVPKAAEWDPVAYRAAVTSTLEVLFQTMPTWATSVGEHDFDDQWPDVTKKGEDAVAADFVSRAAALRTIAKAAPESADPKDANTDHPKLDALLLADRLDAVAARTRIIKPYERDPSAVLGLVGHGVSSITSHPYAPLHARMNALDTRLSLVPDLLTAARARVSEPTRASLENLALVAGGLAKLLRSDLVRPSAKAVDGDAPLAARLAKHSEEAAKAIDAYAKDVAKAFPVAKAENRPIGKAGLETLMQLFEGVTDSSADVRKMGEAEIARLTAELDALVKESGKPGESRAQFIERLTKTGTVAPGQVLDAYRTANKGVEAWMRTNKFATVPWKDVALEIVESPPHLRGVSFASMNTAGALDAHLSTARFEVNAPDAKTPKAARDALLAFHAKGATENISIHEAIPGHYLQILWQRRSPSTVRKLVWASTFGEGWAHYCEQALLEAGYVGEDKVRGRAFYLRSALQRATRVVVDVGVNDGSLTLEAAAKQLEEHAMLRPEAAKIEARRALLWPANMFSYTYGKLKILALREKVKARDGAKFDLVAFHDRMLALGAVPIRYVGPTALGIAEQ